MEIDWTNLPKFHPKGQSWEGRPGLEKRGRLDANRDQCGQRRAGLQSFNTFECCNIDLQFLLSVLKHFNVTIFVPLTLLLLQVIIERAGRNDGGTYECWDTAGEAASISKQVRGGETK